MRSAALFVVCIGAICLAEARQLRQSTYISVRGQQPAGVWSRTGEDSEAGAASGAKGVRYNAGTITLAGDGAQGPIGQGSVSDGKKGKTRSGNTMAESDTNLGHTVVAATSEGARAVAGSGVSDTAAERGLHRNLPALSGNSASFKPRHINNKGSHAFTDNSGTSAATVGQGNGPVAMAFGDQIGAFSRSHRDKEPWGGPRDGRD